MAKFNEDTGSITVACPGCAGALSAYNWHDGAKGYGVFQNQRDYQFRLYRCSGCGTGGMAQIWGVSLQSFPSGVPGLRPRLVKFFPESVRRVALPMGVPDGIKLEFEEGERCLEAGAHRAAAAMFRSVLDKVFRENGYKAKRGTNLEQQIDLAAKDGVITAARQKRAHDEVRVLGNDVLHESWSQIELSDVELSRHYAQRVLEDFYDERESVIKLLEASGRLPLKPDEPYAAS